MSAEDEDEWDTDFESSVNSSEIEDWEVLGIYALYLDCEKGMPAAYPGGSFDLCPQEFLQTLIDDLLEVRAMCLTDGDFEDDELNHDMVEEFLAVIGEEIDRLHEYPELFPSDDIRQQFFGFVHQILHGWNTAFDKIKAMQMKHGDIIQEAVTAEKHESRPAYTGPVFVLTKWTLKDPPKLHPWALFRLLGSWNKESVNIVRDVRATREGPPLTRPGGMINLKNPGIAGNGRFRKLRRVLARTARNTPLTVKRLGENDGLEKPKKLEELNIDFGGFEGGENEQPPVSRGSGVLVHDS